MRRTRAIETGLWSASIVLAIATVIASRTRTAQRPSDRRPVAALIHDVGVSPVATLTAAAHELVATDPFRIDRQPAAVQYHPDADGASAKPTPPRPVLGVEGIVGSRADRWAAVLDGIPGRVGSTVVHAGDTVGGLSVRRIGRDTVVVTSIDTTWRLTVRHPW
jgi:hypothetical protein